jgi:hypothetical protein
MHRSASKFIGFSLLTAFAAAGCGGSDKQNPQTANNMQYQQQGYQQQYPQNPQAQYPQNPQAQYPQNPQAQYPQNPQAQNTQAQYPPQNTPQGTPTTAPTQTAPAAQGPTAQPVDASMAAAVRPILQQLGKTQAPPGAKALGALIVANFAQGQTFEQSIQLQANKCYTIVAAGAPGVNEVNIKLMPPVIPTTLAQDNSTGPQATLGQTPNCWKNGPFPAPMRVIFEVPSGQGIVAAQIYEK